MLNQVNTKIGLIFVCSSYATQIPRMLHSKYKIFVIERFDEKEWCIDLKELERSVTQIVWHSSEDIVDPNAFSLDDLYYATI